ncbi:hypothetical protein DSM104329_00443 [Capillimicrobium parvum]|uniref:HTH gntR-type domain-containing protein n=1 Tax=Capillimicrobium parvum TaxID=2884022 RepID=A0A9E6XUL7_9ACTN|nr:hypothetical protein DSM104329_00443 [Capillimicrobium parvum]
MFGALAQEFGVSAQPVREAIRRLEAEGLVHYEANAGAVVAPASPELFEDGLQALALLEGYATATAAAHVPVEALEAEVEAMRTALDGLDVAGFEAADQRFHEQLRDHCRNPLLRGLLHELRQRALVVRRSAFAGLPRRGSQSIAEHEEIVGLIRSGAPAGEVEAAASRHVTADIEAFRAWSARAARPAEPSPERPRGRAAAAR